jgi:hypothetical protein
LVAALLVAATPARAQHDHAAPVPAGKWVWAFQGQGFLNLNLQTRKFRDFHQLESQNWGMVRAARRLGRATVTFHGMLSAEPWTLRRLGSAQVLQVGESLDGGPLLDYQHPHDLFMAIDARLNWAAAEQTILFVSGGPVAAPALGPRPFMHRASAGPNPTAPLSHHMLDSTHITHGVITAGVTRADWTVEASAFHGREPDDDRVRLDMGPLDSVSGRLVWQRGPWLAQVSAGHLNEPELAEPGDVVRATASLAYETPGLGGGMAWTIAWGRNHRSDHAETGWLLEGRKAVSDRTTVYGRAELVDRFLLVDFDYAAATGLERHLPSTVSAVTMGFERRVLWRGPVAGALGVDLTLHRPSDNLRDIYGFPVSWHLFFRIW